MWRPKAARPSVRRMTTTMHTSSKSMPVGPKPKANARSAAPANAVASVAANAAGGAGVAAADAAVAKDAKADRVKVSRATTLRSTPRRTVSFTSNGGEQAAPQDDQNDGLPDAEGQPHRAPKVAPVNGDRPMVKATTFAAAAAAAAVADAATNIATRRDSKRTTRRTTTLSGTLVPSKIRRPTAHRALTRAFRTSGPGAGLRSAARSSPAPVEMTPPAAPSQDAPRRRSTIREAAPVSSGATSSPSPAPTLPNRRRP